MAQIDDTIKANEGLAWNMLRKMHLHTDPEAISLAFEALWRAIENYDSSKGTKLSTVASVYIYNRLGSYIRSLNKKQQLEVVSYNNIAYNDDDGGHEHLEFLVDDFDIDRNFNVAAFKEDVSAALADARESLTSDKQRAVFDIWVTSEFEESTSKIAKLAGVSQPQASETLNRVKFRLKKGLKEYV